LAAQARDFRGYFLPSAIYTAENEGLNCESCLLDLCAGAVFAKSRRFGGLVFNKKLFLAPWSLSMISLFRGLALSGHPGPPGESPGRLSCLSRPLPTSSLGASWRLLAPSGAFWRLLGASWLLLWRLLVPPGAFWCLLAPIWCSYNKQRHARPQPRSVTPALQGQVLRFVVELCMRVLFATSQYMNHVQFVAQTVIRRRRHSTNVKCPHGIGRDSGSGKCRGL